MRVSGDTMVSPRPYTDLHGLLQRAYGVRTVQIQTLLPRGSPNSWTIFPVSVDLPGYLMPLPSVVTDERTPHPTSRKRFQLLLLALLSTFFL